MKRNKIVTVTKTTSIELPEKNLTPMQLLRLQIATMGELAKAQLAMSEAMLEITKMTVERMRAQRQGSQHPQSAIQHLLRRGNDDRLLN